MPILTPEQRQEIAAVVAKATKGPLTVGRVPEHEEPDTCIIGSDHLFWARVVGSPGREAEPDAQLFGHAEYYLSKLLASHEEAEGRVAELVDCLRELVDFGGPPPRLNHRDRYFEQKERAQKLLAALEDANG